MATQTRPVAPPSEPAVMVATAEAAGVPAAEYLAHRLGWQAALGGLATSNLVALVMFGLLGYSLYRVASR